MSSRGVVLPGPMLLLALILLIAAAGVLLAGLSVTRSRALTAEPSGPGVDRIACGPGGPATDGVRWWRSVPVVTALGGLDGWALRLGAQGEAVSTLRLPAESTVDGPVRGVVAVAADDGLASTVRLVDRMRCGRSVVRLDEVVRAIALDPQAARLAVHLVDRTTRADLGVRVVDADSWATLARIAPPPSTELAGAGVGRTWRTLLQWDRSGERLVVQSCGPRGCLTRIVTAADGRVVGGVASTADVVDLDSDRLVAWGRCSAVPCPLLAVDIGTGRTTVLESDAVAARSVGPGMVAVETAGGPGRIRVHDRGSRTVTDRTPDDRRSTSLLPGPARSDAGVELPAGWIPLVAAGSDPGLALRIADGSLARLEEVTQ